MAFPFAIFGQELAFFQDNKIVCLVTPENLDNALYFHTLISFFLKKKHDPKVDKNMNNMVIIRINRCLYDILYQKNTGIIQQVFSPLEFACNKQII